jgi:hypothetical protein
VSCQPSLPKGTPAKRDDLPPNRAGSFALRISAIPHLCGKSPACLPSTVYKASSTTERPADREIDARSRPRRAVPSLMPDVRSAAVDASGMVPSRSLPAWHSRLCSRVETASAQIVEPPPGRAAHRNHLARHEQRRLMERPGDPRRANASHPVEPRLSRLLLPARDLCDGKALPPIQEFLARMIGMRRDLDRGACISTGPASPATAADKSKSSMSTALRKTPCACSRAIRPADECDERIAAARAGYLAGRSPLSNTARRAAPTACVYFASSACQVNVQGCNLHFGLHALDARDRLGP